jgi:hypothetical protein
MKAGMEWGCPFILYICRLFVIFHYGYNFPSQTVEGGGIRLALGKDTEKFVIWHSTSCADFHTNIYKL